MGKALPGIDAPGIDFHHEISLIPVDSSRIGCFSFFTQHM
jgi:hypothetical protein